MRYQDRLGDFLFGRRSARRAVLEMLFSNPSLRTHLRELARSTGFSAPMVAKEVATLIEARLVNESREGNTRVFQANIHSPLAEDIRRLVEKGPRTARSSASTVSRVAEASRRRPRSLAEAARWGRTMKNRDAMIREFCDEFYLASPEFRATMLEHEPALLANDAEANAYYAAIAEHLALQNRLSVPAWALGSRRFLAKPFFPAGLESLKSTLLVESPVAFRRRMIFVGADPLSRPRRSIAPSRAALSRKDILRGLRRLDELAKEHGKIVDIAVYGGAALSLAFDMRVTTRDVDAVIRGARNFIRSAARQVAQEEGWPEDWINDGVKGFVSPREELSLMQEFAGEGPGLRIYMPSPQYLFAMKCMAMRPEGLDGSHDISDIEALADEAEVPDAASALALVEAFYPNRAIPPKVQFAVEEIMERVLARRSGNTPKKRR